MAGSDKRISEESTLIKIYEDLDKSRTSIIAREAFPLLEVVHGPKQGNWFSLADGKEHTIGRSATNSIIFEDNSVSRSHLVVQQTDSGYMVQDIGSRNGSFVNGKKIREATPLTHLDTIKVGIYTMRFLEEPTELPFEMEDETSHATSEVAAAPVVEEGPSVAATSEALPVSLSENIETISPPPEEQAPPEKPADKKKKKKLALPIFLLVLVALGAGLYFSGMPQRWLAAWKASRPAKEIPVGPSQVLKPQVPAVVGKKIPVFLEVDSVPIPAQVFYQDKNIGVTPFNVSMQIPAGVAQEIRAEYLLEGIQEKFFDRQSFQVQSQDEVVKVSFRPKLGTLQVQALPKDGQLYLEGKYVGTDKSKAIKLGEINLNTPIYLPYGKYFAEIRMPEALEGSRSTLPVIRYRREFEISDQNPQFAVQATDDTIKTFPAEIGSDPTGAELWVDGKKMGETPFKGPLPTGRHQLVLKKEGFNDFEKELNIELNTPYATNFSLKTTPAGDLINQARSLSRKGLHNEAITQLAEALKLNPEPSELGQIHMLLGDAFVQTKTYDQALAYYQKAEQLPENLQKAKLGKAEALAGLGQKDQALIEVISVFLTTKDEKIRSDVETVYHRISPMKSVLYITSEPSGADVIVNGNAVGQATPVILSDLMVGNYRVQLQRAGFKGYETRVTLPISGIKPVVVKLEPAQ